MEKTAVDTTTQDYWTAYFGDYGRLWVRDIPRYIRAAVEGNLRKAAVVGTPPPATEAEGQVTPLGYAITADRLTLEGRWTGPVRTGRRTAMVAKLFRADFTHDGDLVDLTSLDAPTA